MSGICQYCLADNPDNPEDVPTFARPKDKERHAQQHAAEEEMDLGACLLECFPMPADAPTSPTLPAAPTPPTVTAPSTPPLAPLAETSTVAPDSRPPSVGDVPPLGDSSSFTPLPLGDSTPRSSPHLSDSDHAFHISAQSEDEGTASVSELAGDDEEEKADASSSVEEISLQGNRRKEVETLRDFSYAALLARRPYHFLRCPKAIVAASKHLRAFTGSLKGMPPACHFPLEPAPKTCDKGLARHSAQRVFEHCLSHIDVKTVTCRRCPGGKPLKPRNFRPHCRKEHPGLNPKLTNNLWNAHRQAYIAALELCYPVKKASPLAGDSEAEAERVAVVPARYESILLCLVSRPERSLTCQYSGCNVAINMDPKSGKAQLERHIGRHLKLRKAYICRSCQKAFLSASDHNSASCPQPLIEDLRWKREEELCMTATWCFRSYLGQLPVTELEPAAKKPRRMPDPGLSPIRMSTFASVEEDLPPSPDSPDPQPAPVFPEAPLSTTLDAPKRGRPRADPEAPTRSLRSSTRSLSRLDGLLLRVRSVVVNKGGVECGLRAPLAGELAHRGGAGGALPGPPGTTRLALPTLPGPRLQRRRALRQGAQGTPPRRRGALPLPFPPSQAPHLQDLRESFESELIGIIRLCIPHIQA